MAFSQKFTARDAKLFVKKQWALSRQNEGDLSDLLANQRAARRGVIPSARMAFSVNPSNNDTMQVGAGSIKFVTALGGVVAQTQVLIGVNAAATLAVVINALNGVADATNILAGSTPLAAKVFADAVTATVLRIRGAFVLGGSVIAAPAASTVLAASISGGASAWNVTNLNASGGKNLSDQDSSRGRFAVTAGMITNATYDVELPFAATCLQWDGYASTGVKRAVNEAVTLVTAADGTVAIHMVLAGGASPNWQAGDFFEFSANV